MSQNDEVIYAAFALTAPTRRRSPAPGGYTKVWEELTASTTQAGSAAYKITAAGGAENPTWGLTGSDTWFAVVATFPVGGGGPTAPTTGMRIQNALHPGRSPGKGVASGRFIQRPGATSATGLGGGGGGGGALGNQNLSVQSTPDEGGGTLLTAFQQLGSAAIGGHGMDRNNVGTPVVVTFNSQVSGSTFIIDLTTVYGTPSNFTISDNKGNTYTEIVRADNFYPTYSLVRLVCFNGVGGTGHQFTVSDSGGHEMCIYVTELTNCTALAGTSGATNSSVSGLNLTSTGPTDSGNLNVTDSAALMHGAHSGNGLTFSYTFVGNPGYTELDTEPGPNQAQGASFYKLARHDDPSGFGGPRWEPPLLERRHRSGRAGGPSRGQRNHRGHGHRQRQRGRRCQCRSHRPGRHGKRGHAHAERHSRDHGQRDRLRARHARARDVARARRSGDHAGGRNRGAELHGSARGIRGHDGDGHGDAGVRLHGSAHGQRRDGFGGRRRAVRDRRAGGRIRVGAAGRLHAHAYKSDDRVGIIHGDGGGSVDSGAAAGGPEFEFQRGQRVASGGRSAGACGHHLRGGPCFVSIGRPGGARGGVHHHKRGRDARAQGSAARPWIHAATVW
jgi:hypothetical protein